jgi:hypothetical protein
MTEVDVVLHYDDHREELIKLTPKQFAPVPAVFLMTALQEYTYLHDKGDEKAKDILRNVHSFTLDFLMNSPCEYVLFMKLLIIREGGEKFVDDYLYAYPEENERIAALLISSKEIFKSE